MWDVTIGSTVCPYNAKGQCFFKSASVECTEENCPKKPGAYRKAMEEAMLKLRRGNNSAAFWHLKKFLEG